MIDQKAQQRLNDYLKKIEEALSEISVADRSDILLELNSHISESIENGNQDIDQVLAALGAPEQVANRYLLDRGIQPIPPRKFTWLKALGLGTVGVMSLAVIALVLVIRSFMPLISVNEEEGRVIILGGMIDVNEKKGTVSLGKGLIHVTDPDTGEEVEIDLDFEIGGDNSRKFAGELAVDKKKRIVIRGQNGKFQVSPSEGESFKYECKIGGVGSTDSIGSLVDTKSETDISFELPTDILKASKCKFKVPKNLEVKMDIGNGKVLLEQLQQDVFVKLANGKVVFDREPKTAYKFETKVLSGKVVGLKESDYSNTDEKAFKVKLEASNGKILVR